MWNALRSYNNGTSWLPYVDSATIYLDKNIHSESKYQLADDHTAWIFGAAHLLTGVI